MGSWRRKIRAINVRTQPRRAAPGERAPAGMSRQVHVAGGRAGQEARQRGRLRIAGLVLAAGFIIVAARALDVSLVSGATAGPGLQAAGEATVRRAALTDRHGQVLASTLDFHAAYANGQHIPRELVDETVARFTPRPSHTAMPGFVYGGLAASLVDCHAMGTAAAAAERAAGRAIGDGPAPRYVTAVLNVTYLKPTPLGPELELRGRVLELGARKAVVAVSLLAAGEVTVRGEVVAVRLPESMTLARD